jgi:hypothetical protein
MDGDQAERWKPVVGWETFYLVSDCGNVRSLPRSVAGSKKGIRELQGQRLTLSRRTDGYLYVRLCNGTHIHKRIHVLVCEAFNGIRPSEQHQVAHYDGDKANNRATNLRWATRSENMQDCFRHGTMKRGEESHAAKVTLQDVVHIRELRLMGFRVNNIAILWGIRRQRVGAIANGRAWVSPPSVVA